MSARRYAYAALVRNMDWNVQLSVVNARVAASYAHFDRTCMLSVLAYVPNVISCEFVIG